MYKRGDIDTYSEHSQLASMHLETQLVIFFCLLGSALALPIKGNQASNSAITGAGNEIDDIFARIIEVNRGAKIRLQKTDIRLITSRNANICPDGRCLWPRSSDGRVLVPYVLSSDFDVNAAALFTSVMQDFAALTCVNFVPRKKETDYLNIISDNGCYSTIGRNGGMQTLSLAVYGCLVRGIIEHELMHNLGFDHEHSRKDRDSYISIMWQYINSGDRPNFEIQSNGNLLDLPYDYNSVMHYGSKAYSNTSGQDTIIPKPVKDVSIGQRVGFSGLDVAKINKLYNCTFCTYLFTDRSGTFSFTAQTALSPSPGSCLWYIRAKKQVALWINDYNIVSSPNCQLNYLRVYDGDSKRANIILDKTCGQGAGLSLLTSGVTMLVEFVYNNPRASNSFNAAYNTDNCGGTFTRTSGTVTSPNYPFASPPSTYCNWTISAPQGYKIALNMLTLNFPLQYNCQTDSLSVYDDAKPGSSFVGSYCTQLPGIITSYGTRLRLMFMGHSNRANIGFLVTYSFVPFPLVLTSLTGRISSPSYPYPYANNATSLWLIQLPANNKVCLWFDAMNILATAGCTTDYIKVYNGSSQAAQVLMNKRCGKTLPQPVTASSNQMLVEFVANSFVTGNGFQASYGNAFPWITLSGINGFIFPANYKTLYPNYDGSLWLIQIPSNQILLDFSAGVSSSSTCVADSIIVYDGPSKTVPLLLSRTCASGQLPLLVSSGNSLLVQFINKGPINPINFSPSYTTVKCGGTLTSPSGSFSSPEYPSAYPNYLDCTWVMLAPVGNQILFSVDFFKVEGNVICSYDYLMIYNGGSSNSPLIGKYCGFVNIAPYTSTGNALRIVFQSDQNTQFSGFVARYSFVSAS